MDFNTLLKWALSKRVIHARNNLTRELGGIEMAIPKITGSETETGLQVLKNGVDPPWLRLYALRILLSLAEKHLLNTPFGACFESRYQELTGLERKPEKGEVVGHTDISGGIMTPRVRIYGDIGDHFESCISESGRAKEVALNEFWFEQLWEELRPLLEAEFTGFQPEVMPTLYKGNSDGHGHSWGYHLNISFPAQYPLPKLIDKYLPFLVVQSMLFGAGKFWKELCDWNWDKEVGFPTRKWGFELSQRAEFFDLDIGGGTMDDRAVFNLKHEPHADEYLYRRLHQIVFDTNRSLLATWLKVGFNQLVLAMIEDDFFEEDLAFTSPEISYGRLKSMSRSNEPAITSNSARALKIISGDLTFQHKLLLWDNREITGLDILARYVECARRYVAETGASAVPDAGEIVDQISKQVEFLLTIREKHRNDLEGFLGALISNESPLVRTTDWALKLKIVHHRLVNTFGNNRQISWHKILGTERMTKEEKTYIKAFQLGYGRVSIHNPSRKYWIGFAQEAGLLPAGEEELNQEPYPTSSRNYLRWELIKRGGNKITGADWYALYLEDERVIGFPHPHRGSLQDSETINTLDECSDFEELLERLQALDIIRIRFLEFKKKTVKPARPTIIVLKKVPKDFAGHHLRQKGRICTYFE